MVGWWQSLIEWWQSLPEGIRYILIALGSATATALVTVYGQALVALLKKLAESVVAVGGRRSRDRRFKAKYRKWFIALHNDITLVGVPIGDRAGRRPTVEEIFVAPNLTAHQASRPSTPGTTEVEIQSSLYPRAPMQDRRETLTIGTLLKQHRQLVILGGPGAGKTTLLQYIGLAAAADRGGKIHLLKREGIRFWTKNLIPVLLPLRCAGQSEASLVDLLDTHVRKASYGALDPPPGFFRRQIEQGNCLLLLDGLDEVPDFENHRAVARAIEGLLAVHEENFLIVTCRTAGWRGLLSDPFGLYKIEDFNEDQTSRFVRNWYNAVTFHALPSGASAEQRQASVREADLCARNLLDAIGEHPRLQRLSGNPLLLSVMASVHRTYAVLPKERAKLYEKCTDLLLEHWDIGLGRRDLTPTGLTLAQKQTLARRVAFELHERGWRQAPRTFIDELVGAVLPDMGQDAGRAAELVRWLEQRTGLLMETEAGILSFAHLGFQEYFTAQAIERDKRDTGSFYLLLDPSRLLDNWWREVVLLFAGLTNGRTATQFISSIYQRDQADLFRRHLFLAAQCLAEAPEVEPNLRHDIVEVLCQIWLNGPYRPLRDRAGGILMEIRGDDVFRTLLARIGRDNTTVANQIRVLKLLGESQVYSKEVFAWAAESLRSRTGPELFDLSVALALFAYWSETLLQEVFDLVLDTASDRDRSWWDRIQVLAGLGGFRRTPSALLHAFDQSLKMPERVPVAVAIGALATLELGEVRWKRVFQVGIKTLIFLLRNRRLWPRETRELAVLFTVSNSVWLMSVWNAQPAPWLRGFWRLARQVARSGPFAWRQVMKCTWLRNQLARRVLLGLQDKDPFIRALASYAICDQTYKNTETIGLLTNLLHDDLWFLRLGAVQALGVLQTSNPSIVDGFGAVREEELPQDLLYVLTSAMKELAAPEFADRLSRLLLDPQVSDVAARLCVPALARIQKGKESLARTLLTAMRRTNRWTRGVIMNNLAEVGFVSPSVLRVAFGTTSGYSSRLTYSYRWTAPERDHEQIAKVIEQIVLPMHASKSMHDRWIATELACELPYPSDKLIEALHLALTDESEQIRQSAANALVQLDAGSDLAADILLDALGDDEQITRDWSFDALWTLGERTGFWVTKRRNAVVDAR